MWKLPIRNHTSIHEEVKIKWPLYRKETRGIRACSWLPTNSVSGLSLLGAPSPTLDPAWPSTLITTYWNILQLSASQLWLILSNAVIVAILLQLFTLHTLKSKHGLWQNCKTICSLIFSSGIKFLESHNHPHHSDFLSMQTSSFYSLKKCMTNPSSKRKAVKRNWKRLTMCSQYLWPLWQRERKVWKSKAWVHLPLIDCPCVTAHCAHHNQGRQRSFSARSFHILPLQNLQFRNLNFIAWSSGFQHYYYRKFPWVRVWGPM